MLAGKKEAGLLVPTGRLRDAGRGREISSGFRGRKGDQLCEISGREAIGRRLEMQLKMRAVLDC